MKGGIVINILIKVTYKTPENVETIFESNFMKSEKAILIVEDMLKTGRIESYECRDDMDQTWTLKQLKKYTEGVIQEPHHIMVYFDGGFDIQTNLSGLGCVIHYEQNNQKYRSRLNARIHEITTNNEAEYAALHFSIKELERLGIQNTKVSFVGDSKVVIHQMNDE